MSICERADGAKTYRYVDIRRTSSQYGCCSIQADGRFLNIPKCKKGKKNIFLCEVTEKVNAGSLYKNATLCHSPVPSRRTKALKAVGEYQALGPLKHYTDY